MPFKNKEACVESCPLYASYIDNETVLNHPRCLSQCKSSAPYIYLETSTTSKCVVFCPEEVPYVDMTQERLTCVAECPEGTTLITDSVSQS